MSAPEREDQDAREVREDREVREERLTVLPGAHGALLAGGDIVPLGYLPSSNETFLVELREGEERGWAVYKPELGERPLRDFPPGLYRRERAAYLLSEHLGWGLVPETIIRQDGPFGPGSLQSFVIAAPQEHYFTLVDEDPSTHAPLRRMAVFDLVANNTDRKAGHVLRGADGRIWGIDHGLCFHAEGKLRTVIWDFAGQRIEEELVDAVAELIDEVPAEIAALLAADEVRALRGRARYLLAARTLPVDESGMAFPWPLI